MDEGVWKMERRCPHASRWRSTEEWWTKALGLENVGCWKAQSRRISSAGSVIISTFALYDPISTFDTASPLQSQSSPSSKAGSVAIFSVVSLPSISGLPPSLSQSYPSDFSFCPLSTLHIMYCWNDIIGLSGPSKFNVKIWVNFITIYKRQKW